MVIRMLDWHPNILVFPREPEFLAAVFRNPNAVFTGSGKEFAFADRDRNATLAQRAQEQFGFAGANHFRSVSSTSFRDCFEDTYDALAGEHPVRRFLEALGSAWLFASPRNHERYARADALIFAFKHPFFCEALAAQLLNAYSDVRLVGMKRHSVARYASAKQRRMSGKDHRIVSAVDGWDYPRYQVAVQLASEWLLRKLAIAHPDWICTLDYETLVSDTTTAQEALTHLLGISANNSMSTQSVMGVPWALPSAYGFYNDGSGLEIERRRRSGAEAVTSGEERAFISLCHQLGTRSATSEDWEQLAATGRQCFPHEDAKSHSLRVAWLGSGQRLLDARSTASLLLAALRETLLPLI